MNGWLIPIDFSLLKLHPQTVEDFPNEINVRSSSWLLIMRVELQIGDERFGLGGISIHRTGTTTSTDHFLSLVPHRSKWALYDGMQEASPTKYIRPDEIAPNFTVSTLYYFICINWWLIIIVVLMVLSPLLCLFIHSYRMCNNKWLIVRLFQIFINKFLLVPNRISTN